MDIQYDSVGQLPPGAIETHLGALAGFARRLDTVPVDGLPVHEQVGDSSRQRPNCTAEGGGGSDAQPGNAAPTCTGEITAPPSLATQAIFTSVRPRAVRVLSKLRQVPRLIQAARENMRGRTDECTCQRWPWTARRGVKTFINTDLLRFFRGLTTSTCWPMARGRVRRRRECRRSAPTPVRAPREPSGSVSRSSSRSSDTKRPSPCRWTSLLAIAMREIRHTRTSSGR